MLKIILYSFLIVISLSAKVSLLERIKQQGKQYQANRYQLSMFYCGFGQDFCGQSDDNDVNKMADYVILAFVDTNPDGSVTMDEESFP